MPITISWLEQSEQPIVIYQYQGYWTWQEWMNATQQFFAAYSTIPPCSMIGDHRHSPHMPIGMLDMMKLINDQGIPGSIEKIVLISPSQVFLYFFKLATHLYPQLAQRYYFCDTFEEALAYIKQGQDR
ncbi:MAG: hypothetical protein ACFE0Q_12585 [Anaerolineae bacterium]